MANTNIEFVHTQPRGLAIESKSVWLELVEEDMINTSQNRASLGVISKNHDKMRSLMKQSRVSPISYQLYLLYVVV